MEKALGALMARCVGAQSAGLGATSNETSEGPWKARLRSGASVPRGGWEDFCTGEGQGRDPHMTQGDTAC